jgi:TPR repeat protein
MDNGLSLKNFMDQYLERWTEEYKQEALNGKIDAMIIYAKLLVNGSSNCKPDIVQAIFWLQKAAFSSPEASFLLGKLYSKGKKLKKDEEKAYYYYRLASSFKCRCGRMEDQYHNYQITNVHSCFPFEAKLQLRSFEMNEINELEKGFQQWIESFGFEA